MSEHRNPKSSDTRPESMIPASPPTVPKGRWANKKEPDWTQLGPNSLTEGADRKMRAKDSG